MDSSATPTARLRPVWPLDAQRLQHDGVVGTADQRIGPNAEANCDVSRGADECADQATLRKVGSNLEPPRR